MASAVPTLDGRTHHDLAVHELLLLLETDPHAGLDDQEAERRLEEYGRNELPKVATVSPLVRLVRQMHNPLIYVLLMAGAVTIFLGEYIDASVILAVVAVNTVIGFIQESKAESALDALRSMVHTEARVVRGGHQRRINSEELVPGDLVLVEAGDKLPADLRLIRQAELQVDESALTGESLPVAKDEVVLPEITPVADRRNMTYSGTFVTGGTGTGIVVATGAATELGEIHRLVGAAEDLATPLTRKLARFSVYLTVVILGLAAVTFAIGVARGEQAVEMFTAAVALAVGAIPEGLPAAVTITLAIGVSRMARRRAVIRRLPAVETLGSATVVCSDKTGTLTENRMTVRALWSADRALDVPADEHADVADTPLGEALRWCLLAGANCNDSKLGPNGSAVGDPTETAMLTVARRYGVEPHALARVDTIPFSSDRQYMATSHRDPVTGTDLVLVKGAVERVLELCATQMSADGSAEPLDRGAVLEAAEHHAEQGMRVLATAVRRDAAPDTLSDLGGTPAPSLTFTGLQAMLDPPRSTAAPAVRTCRTAGLAVKMITGDHAKTAEAIARQIGLLDDDGDGLVLTGAQLDEIDDEHLPAAVERAAVFARVNPEQKLRLVEALQSRHHVVAMTGDGVNDAPALKQADIGVAMGLGGTEVAKEAGDMVLTDDDFATIEAAVEEGRGVFDNLTKFIVWTLPTNMGEGMVILVAILLGSALPILPTQILWINMTTAVALGLMLAWEPKEHGIMERPPRDPRQPLLTGPIVFRTLLVSALLVVGSWWVFDYELSLGASVEASRTAALNVFVVVEAFYLFSCRSLTEPVWRIGFFSNRWLLVGVTIQALGQLAITYLPAMNTLFQTAPIGWDTWGRILLVAAAASAVVAVDKHRLRSRRR
ncbi:MAG TPA: HAD-IC family P-type ATPase [Nocardioidaceae bacterium]